MAKNVNGIPNIRDLTGKKFSKLTVLSYGKKLNGAHHWNCVCDCGNKCLRNGKSMIAGLTKSCGCLIKQSGPKTHGRRYEPEYAVYCAIIDRCENPNNRVYHNYGGRGITICRRWRKSYVNFINDMGRRPEQSKARQFSVERINRNKGYYPSNCKWATYAEQSVNRCNNVLVKIEGRTQTVSQWATESGIKYHVLLDRVTRGWDSERLLNPVQIRKAT